MPPERDIPGSPREWMARARGDLALAKASLPPGGFYDYRRHGWPFRYVHSLEELLTGLRQRGLAVPGDLDESVTLTEYAFGTRYPGTEEPVSREEYEHAVALAEAVVAWAEQEIAR